MSATLEASSKITGNARLRARALAAIQQTAAGKKGEQGPVGLLARAAEKAPDTVAAPFLTQLALNSDVANAACPDCGYSTVSDDAILWVIGAAWEAIALDLYPQAA